MLRSILLYMQRQPKAVRNQYAFAVSGLFTGIIALVWLFTQAAVPAGSDIATDAAADTERTPFATLIEQSKKQFAAARTALQDIGTSTEEKTEETPVSASTLILTNETITDAAEAEAEDLYVAAAATSTSQTVLIKIATTSALHREVQIATTSVPKKTEEIAQ